MDAKEARILALRRSAKRHRDKAEECLRLSEIAENKTVQASYRQIAQGYIAIAEQEERVADTIGKPARKTGSS